MKKLFLLTIFFLLIVLGRAAGQCTHVGTSGATDQTVCNGISIAPIEFTFVGATDVIFDPGTTGLSHSFGSGTLTISGIPSASGTYILKLTDGSSDLCTSTGNITVNSLPVLDAGGAIAAICQGGTTGPLGGSVGVGATGVWTSSDSGGSFDTKSTSDPSDDTYTASLTSPSSVTLTLTATEATCTSTATKTLTVNAKPSSDAGGAIAAICQGGTTGPLGGSVGGGATGVWTSSDSGGSFDTKSTSDPSDDTYTASLTSPSSVTLTLTATEATCTSTATKTLTVNAKPSSDAGGAIAAICQGGTTGPLGGSVGGGATGVWTSSDSGGSFDTKSTSDPSDDTYTASLTSPSSVTLTLTATEGTCTSTATKTLTVNAKPSADAGGAIAAICQGGTTGPLGGSVGGGATGVWTSSDSGGSFDTKGTPDPGDDTYTASGSSPSSVTLTLTATEGTCSSSASKSITVNANPFANAGGATPVICQGGTTIALGGSMSGGAISAIWSSDGGGSFANNDGSTPNTTTFTASETSPLTVTLTLTANSPSCGTHSASKLITLNPLPSLASVSMEGPVCDGTKGNVQLSGLLSNSIFNINYSFSDHTGQTASITTLAGETSKAFLTSVNLNAGDDNGDKLIINSITVTSAIPACVKNFGSPTYETTLQVDQIPTLGTIDLDSPVCEGSTATVTLNGLLGDTPSRIRYTIDGSVYYSDVSPNSSGYVTFESEPLQAENNGGDFYITQVKTAGGAQCYHDYTTSKNHSITVNSLPAPVVSGPLTACAGSTGNAYKTVSSMTNYSWAVTGGTITSSTTTRDITVTWGAGASGTLTVSTTKNGCTGISPVHNVTLNANPGYTVSGFADVCINSTANNYSIQNGMTSYAWSVSAGGTITSSTDGSSITVTWNTLGTQTVTVDYITPTGCSATQNHTVTVHALPVPGITPAVAISPRINDAVIYTTENSAGIGSWSWQLSAGGSGASSTNSINVAWNTTGPQTVKVNYLDAHNCTASAPTQLDVDVRPLPSITGLSISYTYPSVGSSMEALYTYHDGISATSVCTGCTYQWYSNNVAIGGATAKTYIPVAGDANKSLTVSVTPVSAEGINPPYSGSTVTSGPTEIIEDLAAGVPVASQVCIEGVRQEGNVLRGKYIYTYVRPEGTSRYKWIRTDLAEPSSPVITEVGTAIDYTLTADDLTEDVEISFSVQPVSSNKTPIEGIWATSAYIARIKGLKSDYSITDPDVALVPNVPGGSFSGSGVMGNNTSGYVFSPSVAGDGVHSVNYILFYDYTADHSCSQRAPYQITVDPEIPVFSSVESRYCGDGGAFTVTVTNIKIESLSNDFQLIGPDGSVYSDLLTTQYFDPDNLNPARTDYITIDPAVLTSGNHTLIYKYNIKRIVTILTPFGLPRTFIYYLTYSRDVDFYIDKVSTEMKILGLEEAYCVNAGQKYLSVEGVYPLGGTGTWTGDLIKPTPDNLSANIDPVRGVPGTTYVLTYRYMSPHLCPGPMITREVAVKPLPDPAFAIDPTFNVTGDPEQMIPVTHGGVFRGKGVSGDTFIPAVAGTGSHTITYIATENSCVDSSKVTVQVRDALGKFTGIRDTVCYRNAALNISMLNLPVNGTDGVVSYSGFTNSRKTLTKVPGTKTAVYSIPAAGEGYDTLTYSYVWDGVNYDVKKIINIDSVGTAIIYNLQQNQMICDDVAPFELNLSKPGGIFDPHSPVFGGYFDPSKATMSDTVKYTFTSKYGCSVDTAIYVNVYKAPKVDFIPYDICIDDDRDTLMFMNKTTSVNPVVKWQWEFFDEGKMATDSLEESGYLYLKGGLQQVALTAQTDKGCIIRKEKTFNIGRRPEADFYWNKDCFHPGESLQLFDATKYTTQPKSFSWKANGTEFGISNNAVLPKIDTGYIKIQYIVRTDYYMCHDTIVKDIYIKPSITVRADGYFEDFEKGKGGWTAGDNSAIWSFGLPSGTDIKSAASGTNAWFTADARDGNSVIESPCFDLSATNRPLIKLKLRKDLDKERDGAVLQYKIADEKDWHPVGTIDDGIEWYNSATINGKPGGSSLGWTAAGAPDENYRESIHTLDDLVGKKDVKFRLAYGSSGSYSDRDGISFDDIFIGERSRQVLVEHFMSYNNSESMSYKALVDTIMEHKKGDVVNIQYHTNLSGIDSLYIHNPGEINARMLFYGLTRIPYSFVDGGNGNDRTFNKLYDYRSNPIDSNEITKRTLVNSRFRIFIEPVIAGRVLTVKGYIKALENVSINNLTLFIAVTEKKNDSDFSGAPVNTYYINVFRKFIPDPAGIVLKNNWLTGDSIGIAEKTWTIEKVLNHSDIEIIAFLQSTDYKEVYQAFSVVRPEIVVGIENPFGKEGAFSLYPNPASNIITIGFAAPLKSEAVIKIYSIQGEIIREYRAGAGSIKFTVEDPGLKGGIYLVRVSIGNFDVGFKKLIITED